MFRFFFDVRGLAALFPEGNPGRRKTKRLAGVFVFLFPAAYENLRLSALLETKKPRAMLSVFLRGERGFETSLLIYCKQ